MELLSNERLMSAIVSQDGMLDEVSEVREKQVKDTCWKVFEDQIGVLKLANGGFLPWHELGGVKYVSISMDNDENLLYREDEIALALHAAARRHGNQWNGMTLETLKELFEPMPE